MDEENRKGIIRMIITKLNGLKVLLYSTKKHKKMQVTKVIITNTLLYFSMSMLMTMAKSNAIIVHKF